MSKANDSVKDAISEIRLDEIGPTSGIRCDECGARLCGPAPPPTSFEKAWAAHMARRAEAAIAKASRNN